MKELLQRQVETALRLLIDSGELELDAIPEIPLERSRGGEHGDYATPVALALARTLGRKPRELAELIAGRLPANAQLARVEVAGPGFINFFLDRATQSEVVARVLEAGDDFGRSGIGAGRRVQVEFVSANPTGPLHVGHGRGAAYGASVASLLEAAGFAVEREYYVNDAGRQMDILAVSLWLRYLECCDEPLPFPSKGYRGGYVREMAQRLARRDQRAYAHPAAEVSAGLPPDPQGDDATAEEARERHIDALIARAKKLLGDGYGPLFDFALAEQVADIRDDLGAFGVDFDRWFSERSLADSGAIDRAIARLREGGHVYHEDRTLWFRSSALGDEKDRVVVRENGLSTYFASDIAYLNDKFERGYEHVIYVWGADHHGYVARLEAAARALGLDPERVEILLVQFAQLFRGASKVQMSTRSGEFVTLRELRDEVGTDAARFFYVMRRCEQHLDFDLELAKARRNENPVFYVQYAHARIASTLREAAQRGLGADHEHGLTALERLSLDREQTLMRSLSRFPELVVTAAKAREPHQIAFYLRELATEFHAYYTLKDMRLLDPDAELRHARLALCAATSQVLRNGLALLGVSAPDSM